jgi:hypothetical protein
MEASLSAVDPTSATIRRICRSLRDGLHLA